jgi:hypothetical protein
VIKIGNQNNLTHITGNNLNNLSCFSRINDLQKINDNSIISNNNVKTNDLSNINIQSNSYRNDNKTFNNGQSLSKIKKYDESNYISTLDSILEANEEGGNEKCGEEYFKEFKSKIED